MRQNSPALSTWAVRILSVAFIIAAVVSAGMVFNLVRNVAASWDSPGPPDLFPGAGSSDGSQETPVDDAPTATISALTDIPEAWNGTDRVTILLMGLDLRDWEAGVGAPRTDSMMLVTIDPVTLSAGMLSLPRDLWVEIPGYDHGRINTAYALGEQDRYPGGGPALAKATVENFIGVPVQYYAQIDFQTFVDFIDDLGGLDLFVTQHLLLDPLGPDNTIFVPEGPDHFNGDMVLAYARARHTDGGDFDRARRQQQVALAIRDAVLNADMVATLITDAPDMYNRYSSGVRTNLTLEQMIQLGLLALQVEIADVERGVIAPPDMVTLEHIVYGGEEADVLRPVPDGIRRLRDRIFNTGASISPSLEDAEPSEAANLEGASIAVLNGAGESGVAGTFADAVRALGLNVVEVGNADRMDYPTTRIVDYTGNPYTTRYLVEVMELSQSQVLFQSLPGNSIDVAIILGYDWQRVLSLVEAVIN
jgi:LCP family protein required for cell wall assembly